MSFPLFLLAKTDVFVLSGDMFNAEAPIENWDISTWSSKPRESQTISRTKAKQPHFSISASLPRRRF